MISPSSAFRWTLLLPCAAITLWAQPERTSLSGNLRPESIRSSDQGRVDGDFPLPALTLFLKPSPSQQADLRQLLEDQQNPGSPQYHRWLAPEQFADRFGVSRADVASAASWLRGNGFQVGQISAAGPGSPSAVPRAK